MAKSSRRGFLGSAALVAGAVGIEGAAADDDRMRGYTDPTLDGEKLPSFRFAMEEQEGRVTEGGSAKEATIKQLPVSRGLAGVSMRLKPGGIRELHWHAIAAEWAFVIKGQVRTTVIAPDSRSEMNEFDAGDVWYFPRGHGHMLQNIGSSEAHFVLIFDDGAFSEYGTFSSSDWLGHTPPRVLAKSLGVSASSFENFARKELYIVSGRTPPHDLPALHQGQARLTAQTHRYPLMAQRPHTSLAGAGQERRVSAEEFPISADMTGVVLDLEPGAVREPHWHPNADEWQYYISGEAQMTVFGSHSRVRTEDFKAGDAGYVPRGYGHYIENTGNRPLRVLIGFNSGDYQEISLSTWLAANPDGVLADNFKTSDELVARFPKRRVFIASKDGPVA
jgi:oxalate decarboxylase